MYLLPELLRHVGQDPNPAAMRFMALGFVLSDWAARRGLSSRSLAWGVDRVLRALELGQLEVVFDAYGRQSGHVLWTGCDDDLHQRLLAGGPDVAGPLELGRGPILWVLDAALRNGVLDAALLALRDRVWPQADEIFYFRARPAGLQARMLVRTPQLALFRRAGAAADPQSAEMALRASTRQGHAARAELAAAAELGRILWLLRRCATFSRAPLGAAVGELEEDKEVTRVLVADENATVRKILRHLFSSLGWDTLEARNGAEALEMARRRPPPHALIADLKLGEIDGYELCRRIKSDSQLQLIPIIVTAAIDSPQEKLDALEAGADDILTKPLNRAELTVRLRSLLRIHRFNQELIGAESVAMALARAVAAKDGYAQSHLEKVASYAVMLGSALGMSAAELKVLKYGAILHNVGKIAIPDAVLEKTGPLTPREMALFQQHPRIGCDICAPLKPLRPVLPIIRHHKEHWDGTGYPDGLKGDQIPLGAQIVGIVDVYTALTSNRPYRKAVPHAVAVKTLRDQANQGWYQPKLVEQFLACLDSSRCQAADPPDESVEPCSSQDA
jgi:putative two-component system response regulator